MFIVLLTLERLLINVSERLGGDWLARSLDDTETHVKFRFYRQLKCLNLPTFGSVFIMPNFHITSTSMLWRTAPRIITQRQVQGRLAGFGSETSFALWWWKNSSNDFYSPHSYRALFLSKHGLMYSSILSTWSAHRKTQKTGEYLHVLSRMGRIRRWTIKHTT